MPSCRPQICSTQKCCPLNVKERVVGLNAAVAFKLRGYKLQAAYDCTCHSCVPMMPAINLQMRQKAPPLHPFTELCRCAGDEVSKPAVGALPRFCRVDKYRPGMPYLTRINSAFSVCTGSRPASLSPSCSCSGHCSAGLQRSVLNHLHVTLVAVVMLE
jgi:hypothetical protein